MIETGLGDDDMRREQCRFGNDLEAAIEIAFGDFLAQTAGSEVAMDDREGDPLMAVEKGIILEIRQA
jgi:hypothetical protein